MWRKEQPKHFTWCRRGVGEVRHRSPVGSNRFTSTSTKYSSKRFQHTHNFGTTDHRRNPVKDILPRSELPPLIKTDDRFKFTDKNKCVSVFNINHNQTTEEELKCLFSNFGHVIGAKIIWAVKNQYSRGYGFVHFSSEEEARRAQKEAHGIGFQGRVLRVELCDTSHANKKDVAKDKEKEQLGQTLRHNDHTNQAIRHISLKNNDNLTVRVKQETKTRRDLQEKQPSRDTKRHETVNYRRYSSRTPSPFLRGSATKAHRNREILEEPETKESTEKRFYSSRVPSRFHGSQRPLPRDLLKKFVVTIKNSALNPHSSVQNVGGRHSIFRRKNTTLEETNSGRKFSDNKGCGRNVYKRGFSRTPSPFLKRSTAVTRNQVRCGLTRKV